MSTNYVARKQMIQGSVLRVPIFQRFYLFSQYILNCTTWCFVWLLKELLLSLPFSTVKDYFRDTPKIFTDLSKASSKITSEGLVKTLHFKNDSNLCHIFAE